MSNSSKDDGSSGTRTIEDVPVRNAMVLSLLMAHHIPAMLTEKPHLLASGLGITLRGTWFLMQVARVQAGPQELLRSLRMSTCVAAECDGSVPLMGDNAVWMIGRHACDFVAPSPSRLASRWGKAVAVATTRQARVRRFHVDRSTVLLNELGLPIHMNCTVYICLNEKGERDAVHWLACARVTGLTGAAANPLWVFVVVDSACPSTELVDPAVIGVPIPPRPDAVPLSHLM